MAVVLTVGFLHTACHALSEDSSRTNPEDQNRSAQRAASASAGAVPDWLCGSGGLRAAYTFQRPDGNRVASGTGALPETTATEIELEGRPRWLLGLATGENAVLWVVVLDSGRAEGYLLEAGVVSRTAVESHSVGSHGPQLTIDARGKARVVSGLVVNADPYILHQQAVHTCNQTGVSSLPVRPLPDGFLLASGASRLLLLGSPTERYPHAIMGDALEASAIVSIDAGPPLALAGEMLIPPPRVIEGRLPISADLDGDGTKEIIVTLSDAEGGAQIVAYSPTGVQVAAGPPVGKGFRWRHQIAVAPFGPNGELELAEVLTPHIGGVVQFYRRRGARLDIVARVPGYSSHQLGSPNLDMAAAGDFDGDGRIELLVPEPSYERLAAIRRTLESAQAVWALDLGGVLSTNIATTTDANGQIAVGVGTKNGRLRIWQSR